jgi:two-component system cell cycle sensor histidine kinase/response regulator CckA
LVEDADGVRDLARQVLEELGYTVLVAPHGPAALELIDHYPHPIHLLLTDVVMPGLGGRELAEQLLQSRPDLKIIFMSGYSEEAIADHGMLAPQVFLLQKPFSALRLARKVREVLDQGGEVGRE